MIRIHSLPRVGVTAGAILVAALTAACSPSTQAQPPADPSNAVPTFGANDMPPGTKVMVARQGQWLPATIVQPLAEGRFLVHYDNTGNEWNEVVGPDRIKSNGPAGPARDYRPGEKVLVTYQGKTLLADVVVQSGADQWRVHYDGWGPEAAETVGPDRIRRPFTGQSAHNVGDALLVDVNGQALPAKVIALSAADKWVVRFDSYGAQYDQEVGADRIKPPAPAAAPPPPPAPPPVEPPPVAKVDEKADKKGKEKDKGKEKEKDKPKAPVGEAAPAPQSGPPGTGETVFVNVRGAWFPATVSATASGGFKVKFGGGAEEEIPADRILREPASTKGLRYQPGQLVLVGYKGVYVPAKVIKAEGKDYKVRFEGTGPEEDEVVQVKRLRPR
jgi:hypothetical protein